MNRLFSACILTKWQDLAENRLQIRNTFISFGNMLIWFLQAIPSSTECLLQIQYRYPSPLRRSVHPGRPPFFVVPDHVRNARQPAGTYQFFATSIDPNYVRSHVDAQGTQRGVAAIGSGRGLCDLQNRGARPCEKHFFGRALPGSYSRSRRVIQMPSADSLAPVPARPCPWPPEAIRSWAVCWVARQASSATTRASANRSNLILRDRKQVLDRSPTRKLGHRSFCHGHPISGLQGGHRCSRKS